MGGVSGLTHIVHIGDKNSEKFLSFHAPKILETFAVIYGPWKHYKESPRRLVLFSFVCLHIVILFFSFVADVCLFFFGWLLLLFYWPQLSEKMNTWNTTNFGLGESGEYYFLPNILKTWQRLSLVYVISDKWKRQREHLVHTLLYKKCIYIRQISNWPFLLLFDDIVVVVVAFFYLLQIL